MCQLDSPFYLAINYKPIAGSKWYKKQRMGKDRIGQFMKRIACDGSLKGRKTNHSARKTMIISLASSNIPDTQIMQLSGHRNVQSLNSYKQASLQQQQKMSHILSSYNKEVTSGQIQKRDTEFSPQQHPASSNSAMPPELLQGATISHSTIHINCNTSNLGHTCTSARNTI